MDAETTTQTPLAAAVADLDGLIHTLHVEAGRAAHAHRRDAVHHAAHALRAILRAVMAGRWLEAAARLQQIDPSIHDRIPATIVEIATQTLLAERARP